MKTREYIVLQDEDGFLHFGDELIRCKDCKWYDNIGCALIIVDEEDRPKPDDFCSYGERKEE